MALGLGREPAIGREPVRTPVIGRTMEPPPPPPPRAGLRWRRVGVGVGVEAASGREMLRADEPVSGGMARWCRQLRRVRLGSSPRMCTTAHCPATRKKG
jgi:hypothetical protein